MIAKGFNTPYGTLIYFILHGEPIYFTILN